MSEWRELLGDEFQYAKQRYLRPTDWIAEVYPCPSPGGENCPRGIVEHGYNDFTAYCREVPKRCETIELKRADVILYEFDVRRLARDLAEALKLKSNEPNPEIKPSRPLKLGELQISPFRNIPVYLMIRTPFLDPHPVIHNLYMETSSPLLILTTSSLNLKYQWLNSWRSNSVVAMEISTLMDWTAAGDWRVLYPPDEAYHNALQPPAISIPSERKAVLVIDKTRYEARFRGKPLKLAAKDFDMLVFLVSCQASIVG
jgi:hypothetical protein